MDYIAPRNDPPTQEEPRPDYIDGDRGAGIKGSIPPAAFFQSVLDELLHLIETVQAATEDETLLPDDEDLTQVYRAIVALIESYGYLTANDLPAGAALIRPDLFIVVDGWLADPPADPADGDRYVVESNPTGAWVGHAQTIAHWNAAAEGGAAWAFVSPRTGMMVAMKEDDLAQILKFNGTTWAYLHAGIEQPGLVTLYNADDNPNGVLRGGDMPEASAFAIYAEERASGAPVYALSAATTRKLNTENHNTIGAVLAANKVTVPAGTYRVTAWALCAGAGYHALRLYNETTSAVLVYGNSPDSQPADGASANTSHLDGVITLAAQSSLILQHSASGGGSHLSAAGNAGHAITTDSILMMEAI